MILREEILHHQIGVQRRNAIYRKTADYAQVRHAHLFVMQHRQFRPDRFIARPLLLHQLLKASVDLFNNGEMARQQRAHQALVPAFQRFRHQRMVSVGEDVAGNTPRLLPLQLMLIQQQAQHFRDGDSGMGIVKLDHLIIGQLRQRAARQVMTAQNIRHRAGALEILLHQTQPLAFLMVIVGIEHLGQLRRIDAPLLRLQEFAVVEQRQVERVRVGRLPQAQRLRDAVAIADDRQIPGFAAHHERRFPPQRTVIVFYYFAADAHFDIQRAVMAKPWIAVASPVVRRFALVTLVERLAEQAVLVVQTVADGGLADRRH